MVSRTSEILSAQTPLRLTAWPTLLLAIATILPFVVISLLAWNQAAVLRGLVPPDVDLTGLDATARMLWNFVHGSVRGDSWWPARNALTVMDGPHRDALYETLFFKGHVRFQYPPTSLLPIDLLTRFGVADFRTLNALNNMAFILNAAGAGFLAWLLFRVPSPTTAPGSFAPPALAVAILAVIGAFLFYPLVWASVLGQVQIGIDLVFTGAMILWLLHRKFAAGALIGLACAIKPQFAPLLVWALLWGERRFAAGLVAAFAPLVVISILRYGWHNHFAYLDVLAHLSRHGETFISNHSVNGILNRYFLPGDSLRWNGAAFPPAQPDVYAGTLAAALVILAILLLPPLLLRKVRRPGLPDLAAASICTVIGSPIAWEHHYGILFPLYLVALRLIFDLRPGRGQFFAIAALLLSWTLVANFIPFVFLLVGTPVSILTAYCLFGALVLLVLFLAAALRPPILHSPGMDR